MGKYKYSKYNKIVLFKGQNYMAAGFAKSNATSVSGTNEVYKLNASTLTFPISTVQASTLANGDIFAHGEYDSRIELFNIGNLTDLTFFFKQETTYYYSTTSLKYGRSDLSYGKGSFIEEVIAEDGTFPNDGLHSDGFYYVKGALATIPINVLVNGNFVDSEKAYVNVNGVWKEILEFHQVQNNQWVKLF